MEDFEYFERWNPVLRWMLFLPMLIITYTIVYFVGGFALSYGFGFIGFESTGIIYLVIQGFLINFTCFFLSLTISVSCAPKGKIIISSIYLGFIVFLLGIATLSVITYGDPNGAPLWSVFYSYGLNLFAAILSLLATIDREKKRKLELMYIEDEDSSLHA